MKYGFIGCGNMGGALAEALTVETKDVMLSDRSGNGRQLAETFGCTYGTATEVAETCSRIFIAVKPNMVQSVLAPLQPILAEKKPLLISMAAGLKISTIESYAGVALPVIRIMPNTPVCVGKGMIPYCCNNLVDTDTLEDFLSDMFASGHWDCIDESLMDTASALSGSGPAYLYRFVEALRDSAIQCGFPEDKALDYVVQTLIGAGEMLNQGAGTPAQLREAVCSPGGSTLAGLKALEDAGFDNCVNACIRAAYNRNIELGKQ